MDWEVRDRTRMLRNHFEERGEDERSEVGHIYIPRKVIYSFMHW